MWFFVFLDIWVERIGIVSLRFCLLCTISQIPRDVVRCSVVLVFFCGFPMLKCGWFAESMAVISSVLCKRVRWMRVR